MPIIFTCMLPHPPLIVPAIGKGEERKIQKTIDAYHETARRIAACRPETIILISPHQIMYADYFHISPGESADGDFGQFRAPEEQMTVSYDTAFVEKLCALAAEKDLPAGTLGEHDRKLDHGTMVPLYFVNQYWTDYQLVRVGLSGLPLISHYELGQCIQETANALNRKVVIIASGDLSHRLKEDGPYGYREEGPAYDARIMDVMGRGDFGELMEFPEDFCEKAGECGHRSFTIMAGALDKRKVTAEKLSYEGPFGVGYGICTYNVYEDAYVQLARKTIEAYVRTGKKIEVPDGLPQEMYERQAGTFVSIKENGGLRGCIGTIQAVQASIAEEIINNAISAAVRDPRFYPIEPEELDKLTISVDVLGETERIDSPEQLDVQRYGVIVTKGYKRGLLLPNLDGVDTVEEQIAIAMDKAGISAQEEIELERFEVVRHY
ncbi:MAG: AmmeMemoRadiSam system protein A [Lachnospiraceae bacterium]|nr:AmmeMemoRadiSam system protein A [Lachnospiraceae bacterium]